MASIIHELFGKMPEHKMRQFCRENHLQYAQIRQWKSGETSPKLNTITKLAAKQGYEVCIMPIKNMHDTTAYKASKLNENYKILKREDRTEVWLHKKMIAYVQDDQLTAIDKHGNAKPVCSINHTVEISEKLTNWRKANGYV